MGGGLEAAGVGVMTGFWPECHLQIYTTRIPERNHFRQGDVPHFHSHFRKYCLLHRRPQQPDLTADLHRSSSAPWAECRQGKAGSLPHEEGKIRSTEARMAFTEGHFKTNGDTSGIFAYLLYVYIKHAPSHIRIGFAPH